MIRIGANPICWSNDDMIEIGGNIPLEQCLSEAREIGLEGMEKGDKFPRQRRRLRLSWRSSGWRSYPAGIRPSFWTRGGRGIRRRSGRSQAAQGRRSGGSGSLRMHPDRPRRQVDAALKAASVTEAE